MNVYNPNCPKLPWMLEFFSTEDGQVLNNQLSAAFADTNLHHLSNLNVKSKVLKFKATQLVCTIPENATCATIEELIYLGISVARIAVSGKECDKILELITKIRVLVENVSRKIGRVYPLAFALDVAGPEIKTGQLANKKEDIFLPKGKVTTLTTDEVYEEFVSEDMIFIDYQKLPEIIQPGDKLLLANGKLHLSAIEVAESVIRCIVDKAGKLIGRSSVIIPNVPIDLPLISEEDKEVIQLAINNHIDFIMVSGIHNRGSIMSIRKIFGPDGDKLQLISKISNSLAIENIDDIIEYSDVIFIDCERLLVEIPKEKVFVAQKSILAKCNLAGKPVLCPVNTSDTVDLSKSDVCDIANAIIDGADALVINKLSCCKEVVKEIAVVCKEAEQAIYQRPLFHELMYSIPIPAESIYSLCISAVAATFKACATAIICLTTSGRTAKLLSRFRPRCPIIMITRYPRIARLLRVNKGVDPIIYLKPFGGNWEKDVEERIQLGVTYGKSQGYIKMGDVIVTVSGSRPDVGLPNTLRIVYASDYDTMVRKAKVMS